MLTNLIGGPMDGETVYIDPTPGIIKIPYFPETEPRVFFEREEGAALPPISGPSYDIVEYRVTRRTRRYCVAEYIAPKVTGRASVRIEIPYHECEALDALHSWSLGRHSELGVGDTTKLVAVMTESVGAMTLDFQTLVDGQPDAAAVAETAENVQRYIDTHIPSVARKKMTITQTGVSVE